MNHEFYDREDGLHHCKVCGGAEGSLTIHCPGTKLPAETDEAVYAGLIEYVDGAWVPGAHQRMTALGIPQCKLLDPGMYQDTVLLEFLAQSDVRELKADFITVSYRKDNRMQNGLNCRLSDGRYAHVWGNDPAQSDRGVATQAWVSVQYPA